jgi:hypothetical protein
MQPSDELEELRVHLDRIRTLLENLVVRGLRACGADELAQIGSFAEHLEQTGVGHLAAVLSDLRDQIQRDERSSPQALLMAQTNVRLLERLLTLRVVKGRYAAAIQMAELATSTPAQDGDAHEDDKEDEDEADEE